MSEAKISYFSLQNCQGKDAKLQWLERVSFEKIEFENINPDSKGNWINLTDNDFDSFLALVDKEVKAGRSEEAVFKLFSRGVETGRDEWIYDFSNKILKDKINFFIDTYNKSIKKQSYEFNIKWNSSLRTHADNKKYLRYQDNLIVRSAWRPFIYKYFYGEKLLNHRLTQNHYEIYGHNPILVSKNQCLIISDIRFRSLFSALAVNVISDLHFCATEDAFQCLPLYRYDEKGDRIDNITDWGLTQFQSHYQDSKITKENIFHYTYAVLHHPHYRTKYELNLKREFPRLPFYQDFHQWTNWGKTLMELHLNYETIQPYGLQQIEIANKENPKAKLKGDKINGVITLDENTQLIGVSAIAWEYKLGNRSALEWILDQYKEKKPKDPTIAKLFNTYKFADYKEQVINLLQRVCTVSVKTMEIIQEMP
jgi:predicted helicase